MKMKGIAMLVVMLMLLTGCGMLPPGMPGGEGQTSPVLNEQQKAGLEKALPALKETVKHHPLVGELIPADTVDGLVDTLGTAIRNPDELTKVKSTKTSVKVLGMTLPPFPTLKNLFGKS